MPTTTRFGSDPDLDVHAHIPLPGETSITNTTPDQVDEVVPVIHFSDSDHNLHVPVSSNHPTDEASPSSVNDDIMENEGSTSPISPSLSSNSPPFIEQVQNAPRTITTRSQHGIHKPNPRYTLLLERDNIPTEPRSVKAALQHDGWRQAMLEELDALQKNETWILVPRESHMNVVGSKWVFKPKLNANGTLDRLKARLVAKGYHQIDGIDYTETFSPVIKPGTIRLVLTLALANNWEIKQLDVKNAFLHGTLNEDIFMQQPPGMFDPNFPNHVCKLLKAIYGLRQASRTWFDRFSTFLIKHGFFCSLADPSLFILHSSLGTLILLLYVDDMLLTGSNSTLLDGFIKLLQSEFAMKDLGPVHHFLGIEIQRNNNNLHLS